MKPLFTLCEEWEQCNNEELRVLSERKEIEGKNFEWPPERKLKELNKICSGCEYPLELHEDRCPVCGGELLTPDLPVPSEFETTSNAQFFYRCMYCKRLLYSFREIN